MSADDHIRRIARDILDIETLETRYASSYDFYELSVWQIRKALLAAYQAGRRDAADNPP